ncbi:MAG: hypothetical protein K2X49_05945 [Acetobacteraceae bacterium]|nr:hypothetical protein [Acetobacteraceae bacterium]
MPRLLLVGREPNEPVPALSVYALDAELRPIAADTVDERGGFTLPEEALKKAVFVGIGAQQEKPPERLNREELVLYRTEQYRTLLKASDVIDLARARWATLFPPFPRCVTGRVRRCSWWPWWQFAQEVTLSTARSSAAALSLRTEVLAGTATSGPAILTQPALRPIPPPFFRCGVVCEGLVEVYQRTCCWWPLVIEDPRIPSIIDILERLDPVVAIPPRFPPIPNPPDPPPFERLALFKGGALDEAALNAPRDLAALRRLPALEQVAYIEARPYLRHLLHCGEPRRVGQGFIQPDGSFQVCWRAFPIFPLPNCRIEVAYVVKQVIGGSTVTIYNGLAANQWFGLGETPTLTSYHPQALGCRDGDDPRVDGAVIYLDAIGSTDAYHLKTPAEAGWDRVGAPAYNDGLCFPAASAAAAKGALLDRNWGGTLNLRWWFTEPCRAAGARYYRASVIAADAAGNPQPGATRVFLAPAGGAWQKLVFTGSGLDLVSVPLGTPGPVGGESNLFTIPYDADLPPTEEWRDAQFHAQLPTGGELEGRYLLTLEVFNAAGQRLRPAGAAGPGVDAGFRYLRWVAPGSPDVFANVPFAGLTAMLWWDNRAGTGDIRGLRRNGAPTTGECQFLSGPAATTLQVDFIAHHPEEMFQLSHGLTWYRGINGTSGSIPVAAPFDNEGTPPATAASSTAVAFSTLLGPHSQCSFAVHLTMGLKTFDGSSSLYPNSVREVAAFALSVV